MLPTMAIMMAALAGPGTETSSQTATSGPVTERAAESTFATVREARESVTRVMRESNRASGRDPAETVASVATIYGQLARSEKLPATERRRLQSQLRARLTEQHEILRRRAQRSGSNSGGVAAQAQSLINLIETTIAPDTWASAGGNGTIVYYPFP